MKKTELSLDFKNLLSNCPNALHKIVDLNIYYLDKIAQIETNLTQRLLTDFRKRLDCLEREVNFLRQENISLKHSLAITEDATKILYLRLDDLPESDTNSLSSLVADALSRTGVTCSTTDLDMVRRIGKRKTNFIRPVLIRFNKQSKRDSILFYRFNLNKNPNDSPLWINDDVSDLTRRSRKTARGVAAQATSLGIENIKLHSDGLIIGDSKFKLHDLDLLPPLLTAASSKTQYINDDIYFQSELSPLSNFFPSMILDSDSTFYESVEQAFQHKKAVAHNNTQLAHKIMKTRDPYEIKRLGNLIDQPNQEWLDSETTVMSTLLKLKFTQNPALGLFLVSTGQKSLHEATGDKTWATGTDLLSSATKNKTWTGNDTLGRLLEEIRHFLLSTTPPPPLTSPTPSPPSTQHDTLSPMPDDDEETDTNSFTDHAQFMSPQQPPITPLSTSLHNQDIQAHTQLPSQTPQTSPNPHRQSPPTSHPSPKPNHYPPTTHVPTIHSAPPTLSASFALPSLPFQHPWSSTGNVITRQPMSPVPRFRAPFTNKHKTNRTQVATEPRRSTRVRFSQSQH